MCSLLARAFKGDLKSIKEQLDEDPDYVEVNRSVDMIIGFKSKRADDAAWDCPILRKLATTSQIDGMIRDIEALPTAKFGGVNKVDLDDTIEIVMKRFVEWCKVAVDGLSAAWEREAKPGPGGGGKVVTPAEFATIMRDVCGRRDIDQDEALKTKIWTSLKSHLMYEDSDPGIDHPQLFAVGCIQVGLIPQIRG